MLGEDRIVALVQNLYPISAHRVSYFEDRELRRIFQSQTGELPLPPIMGDDTPSEEDDPIPLEPKDGSGVGTTSETAAPDEPASTKEAPAAPGQADPEAPRHARTGTPDEAASEERAPEGEPAPASNIVSMKGARKVEAKDGGTEADGEDGRISAKLARLALEQHDVIDRILVDLEDVKRLNRSRLTAAASPDDDAPVTEGEAAIDRCAATTSGPDRTPDEIGAALASVQKANAVRQQDQP